MINFNLNKFTIMTKIFDNIDINILDSNELGLYWHYKIIKDGKIFITGW